MHYFRGIISGRAASPDNPAFLRSMRRPRGPAGARRIAKNGCDSRRRVAAIVSLAQSAYGNRKLETQNPERKPPAQLIVKPVV